MSQRKRKSSDANDSNKKRCEMERALDEPSTSTSGFGLGDSSFLDSEPSEAFRSATVSDLSELTGKISPSRKRSFKRISVANVSPNLPMNDDGTELIDDSTPDTELNKSDGMKIAEPVAQEDEDREMSLVKAMTVDQMKEHVSRCLVLNTENKINSKNAFALRLIDCMTILSKSSDGNNFAALACQLDASAKIYSHRVDIVHNQVMKLVDSCILFEKKALQRKPEDGEEGESSGEDDKDASEDKVREKKKRMKKVLATREQITRQLKESDPRDKHFHCEALPGAIFNRVRNEPEDLSLTLKKEGTFWMPTQYKPTTSKAEKCELTGDYSIKKCLLGPALDETHELDSSTLASMKPSFLEETMDEPLEPVDFDEPAIDYEMEEMDSQESCKSVKGPKFVKDLPPVVSIAMSKLEKEGSMDVSRLDTLKALFHYKGESDFNYFKMSNAKYWAGPKHWKKTMVSAPTGNKKKAALRKKKEPSSIVYSKEAEENMMKLMAQRKSKILPTKRSTTLSGRVFKSWSMKSVTFPPDIHFKPESLLRLFNIQLETSAMLQENIDNQNDIPPNLVDNNRENEDNVPSEDIGLQEMEGPPAEEVFTDSDDEPFLGFPDPESKQDAECASRMDDSDNDAFPNFEGFSPDSDAEIADVKDQELEGAGEGEKAVVKEEEAIRDTAVAGPSSAPQPSTSSNEAKPSISSTSIDVFEGDNLVPMVKTVKVVPIKYTLKPKCIDIKRLKEVMMSIILRMIEDRENELENETRPTIFFKDVLSALYNSDDLSDRTREDLSCQMAFMALLFLANEYSLNLQQDDKNKMSDVKISFFGEKPSREDFPGLYSGEGNVQVYNFQTKTQPEVLPPKDDSKDEDNNAEDK